MESQLTFIIIFVALSAMNYLIRLLPLTLLSQWVLPQRVQIWLRQIPMTVLAAIVFQQLFAKDGNISWRWDDYWLVGAVAAVIIMALTRNLFLVAFGGPAVVLAAGWFSPF